MRFAAPASALTAAIAMTAPASAAIKLKTDRTPPTDVAVRIVARDGSVSFILTNVRGGITISATTATKVMTAGEAATSGTRLIALLSAFTPGTTVEIAAIDTVLQISSTKSRYRLPTLPDTPTAFGIGNGEIGRIELPRADCLHLLDVLPAAATEPTRIYLCGIFLQTVEHELVAAATDGVRLLRLGVVADPFSDDDRLIIPAPAAVTLRRLLRQAKIDSVTLRRSRGLLSITAPGSFELVTALIDGNYPDYRRVMPHAAGNSVTCQRAELLGAFARLKAVSSGLVQLSWEQGDTELLISLPQQPGVGTDKLVARTTGRADMAFALAQLARLIAEFDDDAVHLDVAERALLIRQRDKTGVLASCKWKQAAATSTA